MITQRPMLICPIRLPGVPTSTRRRSACMSGKREELIYQLSKASVSSGHGRCICRAIWSCISKTFSAFLLGRDRAGWIYQGQVAFTVHEFSSSHPPVKGDVDESERVMDRVRNNTIWGIYNLTTYFLGTLPCIPWNSTDLSTG